MAAAAATAAAAEALLRDLTYLAHLATRIAACNLLQAVAGLLIHLLCRRLPSPHHRHLRLALGLPSIAATAALALTLCDPAVCALGCAAAGTLAAFNLPLRAAQLLASPLHAHAKPLPVSAAWLTVMLAVVPACPLLPGLDIAVRRRPAAAAVVPMPGAVRALAQFALGSVLVEAVPAAVLMTTPVMVVLFTLLTSAFATLSASAFSLLTGVPVSAPFSWPWLSPSLASFWAWRWNAPIADALRTGVYDPLLVYASTPPAAAAMAAFVVSGAAHAAILRASGVRDAAACARWFLFFVVQGLGVAAERAAGLAAGPRRAAALGFFLIAVHYLFVLPVSRSVAFVQITWELGTGARIARNCAIFMELV